MPTKIARTYLTLALVILLQILVNIKHTAASTNLQIVFVSVLYRHGDRSPIHLLPNNLQSIKYWPQGLGQLTQRGMRQEAELGRFFRTRYVKLGLINSTYLRKEVKIRSTNYDRTLMSAASQLSALYPPQGRQIWNKNISWQPIPIHTVPKEKDSLLRGKNLPCPRYQQVQKAYENSAVYKKFELKHESFVNSICKLIGYNGTKRFQAMRAVHDALFCMGQHNITLPYWANATVLAILKKMAFFMNSAAFHGFESRKITAGELVYNIVKDMKAVRSGKKGIPTKLMMYSAHDTTVMALLNALGLPPSTNPPYTAAVMIELYIDKKGSHSVQIFYRNTSIPVTLQLHGCQRQCPLDDFVRLTSKVAMAPQDRHTVCKASSAAMTAYGNIVIAVVVCAILLMVILLLFIRHHRKQRSDGAPYSLAPNEDE